MSDDKEKKVFYIDTSHDVETPDVFPPLNLSQHAQSVLTSIGNLLSSYSIAAKSLNIFSENFGKTLSAAISNFYTIDGIFDEYRKAIHTSLDNIRYILSNSLESIRLPYLSDEEKNKLIGSYEQWGKYGWTIIPDSPLKLFYDEPLNSKEANKIAEQYCKKEDIASLFDDMRSKKIKKHDLEEAISCFESKQYKACALIIFGIIDSKLIRMMPKPKNGKAKRASGGRAVKTLNSKIIESEELTVFELLRFHNLISCLSTVFDDGKDFKEEPEIINRNYINHGMNRRNVRRRDCIQLFLLLNNFVDFFE